MNSIAIYYLRLVLDPVRKVARELGYCIAMHGSMQRDFDLVAVPWVEGAAEPEVLVKAVCECVSGHITDSGTEAGKWDPEANTFVKAVITQPEQKPHGRQAWSIQLGLGAFIDLSVMPKRPCMEP